MSGTTSDTHAGPWKGIDRVGDGTKVEGPPVKAQSRSEDPVAQSENCVDEEKRDLRPPAEKDQLARIASGPIAPIQERKRGAQGLHGGETQTRRSFHPGRQIEGGVKGVHMSSAPGDPAIQAISERSGVRNGDKEPAPGSEGPADLPQGGIGILKMLETVVGDDRGYRTVSKRQGDGVRLDKRTPPACVAGRGKVHPKRAKRIGGRVETPGSTAEIDHPTVLPSPSEYFVHTRPPETVDQEPPLADKPGGLCTDCGRRR